MEQKSERIVWVDGLKGIACILVFIHHFTLAFFPASFFGDPSLEHFTNESRLYQSPLSFIINGSFWVSVFCILSGFVMTISFSYKKGKLTNTVLKRYITLSVPVFIISGIIYLLNILGLLFDKSAAKLSGSYAWLGTVVNHNLSVGKLFYSSFISVIFMGDYTFNTAFWMLKYIFFGTILVCVLNFALNNKSNYYLIIVALLGGLLFWKFDLLSCFVFGFILAKVYKSYKSKITNIFSALGVPCILASAFLGGYPSGAEPKNYYKFFRIKNIYYPHILGAVLFVFGIMITIPIVKYLSLKFFLFLGKISFAIYLIHIPVLMSFSCGIFILLKKQGVHYLTDSFITFILSLAVIIGLSYLFNRFIETPCNKLTKKFLNLFQKNKSETKTRSYSK